MTLIVRPDPAPADPGADRGRGRVVDRGSISAFVVVITLTVLTCAGLAVDGARVIGAKVAAADHAENAARAGAQELTGVRSGGTPMLDQGRARAVAQAYLSSHGLVGTVDTSASRITVTVWSTVATTLLRLAGITSKTVSATRSSSPISQ